MNHQMKMLLIDKVSNRAPYWGAEDLIGGENGQGVSKGNFIRSLWEFRVLVHHVAQEAQSSDSTGENQEKRAF